MTARHAMRPGVTTLNLPCPTCGGPMVATFGFRPDGRGSERCELLQLTQRCRCPLSASDVEAAMGAREDLP